MSKTLMLGGAALILLYLIQQRGQQHAYAAGQSGQGGQPQPPAPAPEPQVGNGQAPNDEDLMRAALDPSYAALARDARMNWWAWNYYRTEGAKRILGIENPDPAYYAPKLDDRLQISPQQMLTAGEYHELLRQFVASSGIGDLAWSAGWNRRIP